MPRWIWLHLENSHVSKSDCDSVNLHGNRWQLAIWQMKRRTLRQSEICENISKTLCILLSVTQQALDDKGDELRQIRSLCPACTKVIRWPQFKVMTAMPWTCLETWLRFVETYAKICLQAQKALAIFPCNVTTTSIGLWQIVECRTSCGSIIHITADELILGG